MEQFIHIKGAKTHNLKDLEVKIPHGKMTVITGLSGSGKSSLAFDTLYAEGQRRYIESLSSYARQFLGKLDKPEVDFIKGISPAIAIQQKVTSTNPRSTVGTVTEIYDFLKVLFARVGRTISPISGNEVKKHQVGDVIDALNNFPDGTRSVILAPLNWKKYGIEKQLQLIKEQGYSRVSLDSDTYLIDEVNVKEVSDNSKLELIIDRVTVRKEDADNEARISDSVQLAFAEGNGVCSLSFPKEAKTLEFSNRFELDGMEFVEPSLHFFTFNNPFGACKTCEGFGSILGIDENLVIPNRKLSVYEEAVTPWKGEKSSYFLERFIKESSKVNFPIHRPIDELTEEQFDILWNGSKNIHGVMDFFHELEQKTYKIYNRVLLARYRGKTKCPDCKGTRLRKDANYVKVGGKSISELVLQSVEENLAFFQNIELNEFDKAVAQRILTEITNRLNWLNEVGLGYLSLNRQANSLSGGESQRINLATSLGSALVGSMYILDEPSIGLHPKDTQRLIKVLHELRDLGNTVIVVEHEEAIMRAADEILDIGPMAGVHGGTLVFQGNHDALKKTKNSITADYLTERKIISVPKKRKVFRDKLTLKGASEHNLKNIDVTFPLNALVCVTGVSGSGKSTLITDVFYPALRKKLGIFGDKSGKYDELTGDISQIKEIEYIDQNPIGRSSRSNPVTYVKAFDDIRELFARQKISKARGLKAGYFSFNVPGGRCEMCEGEGVTTVSMQFMADIHLTCEACNGRRYKEEALEINYRNKSIADILEMSIENALLFFTEGTDRIEQKIVEKIQPLVDVGLGYLTMGQPSSTLSGGEAQRIKLASFLIKSKQTNHTLFIFDEPTTGLHFYDIDKLLVAFQRLVEAGHSLIVIEHDMDVVKCSDYIIDLGPVGGDKGGQLMFQGTPEDFIAGNSENPTAQFLREKLSGVKSI